MTYFENVIEFRVMLLNETLATIYMVFLTSLLTGIFGLIIGVMLAVTEQKAIMPMPRLHQMVDKAVNIGRSIPFVILLALIAPLTRWITGTTIGNTAAIVPLVFAAVPFFARQVQNVLAEVDLGVIEAAKSMGFGTLDIVKEIYLGESKEGLIRAMTLTVISIISYSAMAGAIGAGGLGKMAIAYGFNRFNTDITIVATALILLLVFAVQFASDQLIKKLP